jgi:soluble lytic murein transglycosylase-like protein
MSALGKTAAPTLPEGTPYRDLYLQAGKTCPGVSARLLAAQGKQESGWNPRAGSDAGAKGIAQFIDSTWRTWRKGGDVWNPADAIPAQARLMCALYDRYDGNLDRMLSAYNAGTGAVDKYGGPPPYRETQGYIKNIRAIYKGL